MSDVLVKHAFVSPKAASPDATKIDGPKWNANLLFSGGVDGDVPIRDSTAGTGAAWSSSKASVTPSLWFNYAAWGDSLTAGTGGTPYPTILATLTGQTVYNGGVGGDTSTQIATRFAADTTHLGNFVIIWSGRNDSFLPTTVKANVAAMIAALPSPKRYLVLSILNGTAEPAGSPAYVTMMQLNADLAALYPSNFLDIRSYLVSLFQSGVPQDVTDHGNDVPPSTLRSDAVHLNTAGYTAVANSVYAWLQANDVTGRSVARLSDVLAMFPSPPPLGKTGGVQMYLAAGTAAAPSLAFAADTATGFYRLGASQINLSILGGDNIAFGAGGPILGSATALRWGSSGVATPDLFVYRDGANAIGHRNGTNAQNLYVYGTYTDASNYERVRLSASSTAATVMTQFAGTGVVRALQLGVSNGLQWQINTGGHFTAVTDSNNDIGASGANRPRNIFVASSVVNKTKAGTPSDTDVTNPADGMMVLDSTASKIWVRLGGAWKGVAVA